MKRLQVTGSRLIVIAIFGLFAVVSLSAQCVDRPNDPCVAVHQSILDQTSKKLDELKAANDVIAKQGAALAATDVERAAWLSFKSASDNTIAVLQKGNADRDAVIALQDKLFQAVQQLNDRLMAQIGKGKTGWQKFLAALRDIALIAAGITFGRGHL